LRYKELDVSPDVGFRWTNQAGSFMF